MKACPDAEFPPSILIVDESEESRTVFRTVFEQRGVQTYEATDARSGLALLRLHHPRVVVLDLEAELADDQTLRNAYDTESETNHSSLVVLGTARRCPQSAEPHGVPPAHIVAKPYHYGPLIRTIERLL